MWTEIIGTHRLLLHFVDFFSENLIHSFSLSVACMWNIRLLMGFIHSYRSPALWLTFAFLCYFQASSPLQVKYADGELERLGKQNICFLKSCCILIFFVSHQSDWCSCKPEHKLFVGMLPKNVSEAELLSLFSKYGNIKDLQILRGSLQTSKGMLSIISFHCASLLSSL